MCSAAEPITRSPWPEPGPRLSIIRTWRSRVRLWFTSSESWPCWRACRPSTWGKGPPARWSGSSSPETTPFSFRPRISPWSGPTLEKLGKLTLDKADGSTWWGRRGEAEREIQSAAKDLTKHIAKRRRQRAPKLVAPGPAYERFVARFPYFTTPDQAKAIQEVLDDLASGHPMDRVICGDVGFGKTEVALRAAATVALSGKQVAIAVPTTVLARQHVATFRNGSARLESKSETCHGRRRLRKRE